MRSVSPIIAILITGLSTAQTCSSRQEVNPDSETNSCFSTESLTTVSWQKDQIAFFQQPKSGPLQVVTYGYKGEDFLMVSNAFVSSPASYIFDCSGVSIGKRGINYNTFMNEAKRGRVLLEGKY
ncbi:hypothetical protein [Spirosoma pomorum]